MSRTLALVPLVIACALAAAPEATAQDPTGWRPPSAQMPAMPQAADMRGDWLSPRERWFQGLDQVAGVSAGDLRATGEGRPALRIARFTQGPVPVVVWSDRNGDSRADLIEIYRSGGVIIQLIDPDYDGVADVIRYYDASGALLREDRL